MFRRVLTTHAVMALHGCQLISADHAIGVAKTA
jgi:hypothetical protein